MSGPVGSPAKNNAAQDLSSGVIIVVSKDRSQEFFDAMMTQKHPECEDTRPVLGNRISLAADLPEGIPDAELQSRYGGVGGEDYRHLIEEIERRIAACAAYR